MSAKFKVKSAKWQTGFSLAEILVVIAVLGVVGVIITEIFVSSIRGSNKAAVIGNLKRNGQIAMETMDKNIRNARAVLCPYTTSGVVSSDSIVIQTQEEKYIRFKFVPESPAVNPSSNGRIEVETLAPSQSELDNIVNSNCTLTTQNPPDISNLTETNTRTGVSVSVDSGEQVFSRNVSEGFVDIVVIDFKVSPGVAAPPAYAGQVDAEKFQTTIELRSQLRL